MATHTMRIRKGDLVHVLSGKDRGKQGRVIDARPKDGKVVVENINMFKKHRRPRAIQNQTGVGGTVVPGGIVDLPAPMPVANVMLVCPTCKRATRVGIHERELKNGEVARVRVCKRADCLQEIDQV